LAISPGQIEELADLALRVSIRRSGILWPIGQPEEAHQEAALAICAALRYKPDAQREYLFAAALNGVIHYQRSLYRKRIDYVYADDLDQFQAMLEPSAIQRIISRLPELAPLLRRQRRWLTVDTTHEVARELAFLRLRLIGYDLDEIAAKMGYTYGAAVAMSARLLERLQRIADGVFDVAYRRPSVPTAEHTAKMIAAGNSPEARAKHSATLRAACNTPEGRLRMAAAARARWGTR
jgi:hypothetical protein